MLGKDDINEKMPWDRDDLDPNSTYPPSWHDPARAMEQIAAEAAVLEAAKSEKKELSNFLEVPKTEQSVAELSYGQRLVALLLTCGASVLDIALELKLTAEQIARFENNRLITEQVTLYRERFFASDPQTKLKELLPGAIEYIKKVLEEGSNVVDADKKLEAAWRLVEKITGKPAQQIDISASLNFSHVLDEIRKMTAAREAVLSGAQHQVSGSHKIIDVTPPDIPEIPKDQYAQWADEWLKSNPGVN